MIIIKTYKRGPKLAERTPSQCQAFNNLSERVERKCIIVFFDFYPVEPI